MSPRKQATCRLCKKSILFARRPGDGKVVPFDATPNRSSHPLAGVSVLPIDGLRAWKPGPLAEHLQGLYELTSTQAEQQVLDMPWHSFHRCETETDP